MNKQIMILKSLFLSALILLCANDASTQRKHLPKDSSKTVRIDACALVTEKDAEAILGQPVGKPHRGDIGGGVSCTYDTYSTARDFSALTIMINRDADISVSAFKLIASTSNTAEPVSGIGDYAYMSGNSIFILKNKSTIRLETAGSAKRISIEALKTIGKRLATKF
jgi:hypothetical protein